MNLFSKIKQDLEHGGVKVSIQAAQSVSRKDPTLPVTIAISNSSKAIHNIKHVLAEVQATENNSGYGMALNNSVQLGNTTNNNEMYSMETLTVARATSSEEFVLNPNESKSVTLSIAFNNPSMPTDINQYKYELYARADVEGVDLNPHTHQTLQIL